MIPWPAVAPELAPPVGVGGSVDAEDAAEGFELEAPGAVEEKIVEEGSGEFVLEGGGGVDELSCVDVPPPPLLVEIAVVVVERTEDVKVPVEDGELLALPGQKLDTPPGA